MQNIRDAPSLSKQPNPPHHLQTTSPSSQHETTITTLQQLQTALQNANSAKTSLITQLHTLRQSLQSSFDSITSEQALQTAAVERAARSLAVRAMELDNRALQLDHRESTLQSTSSHFDAQHAKRQTILEGESRRIAQKETALLAREASLKYSAVEQMRLHAWSRELEKRETRLGDAEDAEKERIAARIAGVARRELLVAEKETRLDAVMKQREADVLRRERAVDAVAQSLERQRSEALLQIEAERSQFWAHQQKLSAVVAAETESLLAEQTTLRKQFEEDSKAAKLALNQMMDQVSEAKNLVVGESTPHANGFLDSSVAKSTLIDELAALKLKDDAIDRQSSLKNREREQKPD